METDMTRGSIFPIIIRFTIPVMLSNLMQNLYSMADTFLVGRFDSLDGLAAIGNTGPLIFLIVGLATGLTAGFSVIISQKFGAEDRDGMKKSMGMSWLLSIGIGIFLTAIALATHRPLLRLIHTPEDIFEDSAVYLVITYIGMLASIAYNMQSNILRAVGDSRTPLIFLLVTSILNIILDIVFVAFFRWGVFGAGIATLISQIITAVACQIYIEKRYPDLHLTGEDFRVDRRMISALLRIGIPAALQFSVCAIGGIIVQYKVNSFGVVMTASLSLASKITGMIAAIIPAAGVTMGSFCGQNMGACRFDRIRRGAMEAMLLSAVISILLGSISFIWGKDIAFMFVEPEEVQVVENVSLYMNWASAFFIPLSAIFIYRSSCQGLGSGIIPLVSSTIELTSQTFVTFFAVERLGFLGVCLGCPMAWLTAGTFSWIMFHVRLRKVERALAQKQVHAAPDALL